MEYAKIIKIYNFYVWNHKIGYNSYEEVGKIKEGSMYGKFKEKIQFIKKNW